MGRELLVSEEDVRDCAEALLADGKTASPRTIREGLGDRGSYSTITKHLNAWKANRPAVVSPIPLAIPDSIQSAFAAVWRASLTEAHREVQAVRERAAEDVRDAVARLQDALSEVERLEGLAVVDAEKIDSLTAQASERDAQLQKLERQAERTTAERDDARSQLEKVQQELQQSRQGRDTAVTEAAELRGKVEAISKTNIELMAKLAPVEQKPGKPV